MGSISLKVQHFFFCEWFQLDCWLHTLYSLFLWSNLNSNTFPLEGKVAIFTSQVKSKHDNNKTNTWNIGLNKREEHRPIHNQFLHSVFFLSIMWCLLHSLPLFPDKNVIAVFFLGLNTPKQRKRKFSHATLLNLVPKLFFFEISNTWCLINLPRKHCSRLC